MSVSLVWILKNRWLILAGLGAWVCTFSWDTESCLLIWVRFGVAMRLSFKHGLLISARWPEECLDSPEKVASYYTGGLCLWGALHDLCATTFLASRTTCNKLLLPRACGSIMGVTCHVVRSFRQRTLESPGSRLWKG